MNNNKRRITIFQNEYVYSILTKIITVVVGVAFSALFARYVGASLKGEISFVTSVVTTGSIVMSFGVHHAYPFFRKKTNDLNTFITKFASSCFTVFIIFIILGVSLGVALEHFFNFKHVVLIVVLMVLWSYNRVMGYIVLVENPNKKNRAVLIFSILELLFIIPFYLFTKGSFVLGIVCFSFVQFSEIAFYSFCLKNFIKPFSCDLKYWLCLAKYGFLPMVALLMNTLNYRIDIFMLKGHPEISYEQIGIYSIGIALAEKVLLIPDALQEILLSKLAKNKGEDEVAYICRISFPICLLVAFLIVVLGKPFINILYGAEYSGAYYVTIICVLGTSFMVFYKMISQFNIVYKKQKQNVLLLGTGIIVNVILNILLVPLYGISGAAIATCIGYAFSSFMFVLLFSRFTNIRIRDIVFLKKEDLIAVSKLFNKKAKVF